MPKTALQIAFDDDVADDDHRHVCMLLANQELIEAPPTRSGVTRYHEYHDGPRSLALSE